MSFRTIFEMFSCTLACWDTMGSFPRTLQSLDILKEEGHFVHCQISAKREWQGGICTLPNLHTHTHKGIPGVPYPWQSQPQKMVPQTMHLERGSKSNSIEDYLFLDRRHEDHFVTIIVETLQSPGLIKIATTIFKPFLDNLYTI